MAKYIIDIPDEYEKCYVQSPSETLYIPMQVGTHNYNDWVGTGLSVTPYTEPDEDEIRQMAHEEAWDFMYELFFKEYSELNDIFGTQSRTEIMSSMTYAEAKTIYDKWKKEKEEICVGDEVEQTSANGTSVGYKCVVTKIVGDEILKGVTQTGEVVNCSSKVKRWWRKTGRHFPEVAELLKKMKEE